MALVGLIASILVFFLAGYLVTGLYGLRGRERFLFSYVVGCAAVSLQMFFYSLLSVPLGFISVAAPWLLLMVLWRALGRSRGRTLFFESEPTEPWSRLEGLFLIVIASQAFFSLVNSIALPIQGFDTWVIWFMKAKVFYMDGGVEYASFMKTLYSNGNPGAYAYPLLTPLSVTFSYLAMGHVDDRLVKGLFALYYLSLLGIFYHFARSVASREAALAACAMLATVPRVMEQAGLTGVGYVDMPLAVYFIAAAGFGVRYIRSSETRDFVLAALFLAIGAWTKNEGLTFLLLGFLLLSAVALSRDPSKALRPILLSLVTVVVIALPWQIYKAALPELSVGHVTGFSAGMILENLTRLPLIVSTIVPRLFTANKYHITWGVYAIFTLLTLRGIRSRGYGFVQLLLWGQLAAYIFVYVVTPIELKSLIRASIDRLTIHLMPLLYMTVAVCWDRLFLRGDRTRDGWG